MSGEHASRATLDLPGKQQELLEAAVATGKPVVLVLLNGRPLDITWASTHVPAILEAWYPGTEGGNAVADILFGDADPGGKLPVTWPRTVGQIPSTTPTTSPRSPKHRDARYWDGSSAPLYPFGYGLSYSTFTTPTCNSPPAPTRRRHPATSRSTLQNTGNCAADQVVQLYTHQRAGSSTAPSASSKASSASPSAPRNPHRHPHARRPTSGSGAPPPTLVDRARRLRPLGRHRRTPPSTPPSTSSP